MKRTAFTLACLALAAPAFASDNHSSDGPDMVEVDGPITYAMFEPTVEHVDLAECPEGFDNETHFCRMTLASDRAHVFVFAYDGESPLVAIKSFDFDGDLLSF